MPILSTLRLNTSPTAYLSLIPSILTLFALDHYPASMSAPIFENMLVAGGDTQSENKGIQRSGWQRPMWARVVSGSGIPQSTLAEAESSGTKAQETEPLAAISAPDDNLDNDFSKPPPTPNPNTFSFPPPPEAIDYTTENHFPSPSSTRSIPRNNRGYRTSFFVSTTPTRAASPWSPLDVSLVSDHSSILDETLPTIYDPLSSSTSLRAFSLAHAYGEIDTPSAGRTSSPGILRGLGLPGVCAGLGAVSRRIEVGTLDEPSQTLFRETLLTFSSPEYTRDRSAPVAAFHQEEPQAVRDDVFLGQTQRPRSTPARTKSLANLAIGGKMVRSESAVRKLTRDVSAETISSALKRRGRGVFDGNKCARA